MPESNILKKLLSNSVIYAVCTFLQRGLTFILLPLYGRYFSKGEFGAMDNLYQFALILALLGSFGLPQGLVRGFYLDKNENPEEEKWVLGSLLSLLLPWTIFLAGIIFIFSHSLNSLLFKDQGNPLWIQITAGLYLAMSIQQLPLQLYKTRQKAMIYAVWSLITFGVILLGNILFIVVFPMGLTGMLLSYLIGYGATGLILLFPLLKEVVLNLNFEKLRPLFAFGLPMLPALLARKVLEVSDRYMIPQYHSLEELGVYVMGIRVASILEVLVLVPFLFAWQPFYYSQSTNPQAPQLFARVTHYVLILLSSLFLLVEVFKDSILRFFGDTKFIGASSLVTLLVLAVIFNGMQYCISPGIHLKKKLVTEAVLMIFAAILNICLNFIFIPSMGGYGAALATLLSYLFYFLSTTMVSQYHYPVPYQFGRMANLVLQAGIYFYFIKTTHVWGLPIFLILSFLLTGPLLDLYLHKEFSWVKSWLRRK